MYDLGDSLLMAATDRVSAYDVVMPNPVPRKGQTLTAISLFWFEHTRGIVPNHLLSADIGAMPSAVQAYTDQLEGRVMRVQKAERIDIECVVPRATSAARRGANTAKAEPSAASRCRRVCWNRSG